MTNGCTYRDHLAIMVSDSGTVVGHDVSRCVHLGTWQEDMAEIVSLADAIERAVHNGDSVAMEGFTHLIPFAAGREVIRQRRRDLTLIRMTPDVIYDQLIGAGCASKLIFSWGGNPGVGSLHRFRDAVENAWPGPLQLEEHSHAGMANRYVAGASGVPFAILRGYSGTGLEGLTGLSGYPSIRPITCPFTGERLTAVAALNPDVAVIHAQRADRAGSVQLWGITGVQKEAVLSAQRSVVTVEEIVDELDPRPGAIVLPSWVVDYVAEVPDGSHPSYVLGYSVRDNDFYQTWDAISRDRDRFQRWLDDEVFGSEAGSMAAAGAAEGGNE
jgi:glutaconate CoA-transferase subunit A